MIVRKEGTVKEFQASMMSIHHNGTSALFCGAVNAAIVNLSDNKSRMKTSIGRKLKEISICQCSKYGDFIAMAFGNVCKIYDGDMTKQQSLKGHNMSISSIDWHPGTKHQIISSSNDNIKSICIWDIRIPSGPVVAIDACTMQEVKWHKFNAHVFATSSNSEIRLWDQRNLSMPTNMVSAHIDHVSGFDWLPREDKSLISCGQSDGKLKLWNFSEDGRAPKFQVYEATSFSHPKINPTGNLLMTLTTPGALGENQLILWDISSGSDIQKLNSSHFAANTIVEFEWMKVSPDKDQVVSLLKNYDYNIWEVDSSVVATKKDTGDSTINIAAELSQKNDKFYLSPSPHSVGGISKNASETFSNPKKNAWESMVPRYSDPNLANKIKLSKILGPDADSWIQKEFDRLTNSIQTVYDKSPHERKVVAHLTMVNAKCSIMFTYHEAGSEAPWLDATVLPDKSDRLRKQNLDDLEKILKNAALKSSFGISKCVDVATDYINKLSARVNIRTVRTMKETSGGPNFYSNLPDVKVPFPRTCGATFSPSGLLVCFLLPPGYVNKFHTTPRSYVDIAKHSNSSTTGKDIFFGFNKVTPQKTFKVASKKNKISEVSGDMEFSSRMHPSTNPKKHSFNIYVYNAQRLSLFCPMLSRKYSLDVLNIEKMCEINCNAVADSSRKDLTEFWQYCVILANATRPSINDFNNQMRPWPSQLMGRQMCLMWMEHFVRLLDIQSAVMLILVMMAIDSRFDEDFETKYNFSMILVNPKNLSPDCIQDNPCADTTLTASLNSCVNIIYDGLKIYKVYDDKTNAALIISDGSYEGQNRHHSSSIGDTDQQCGVSRKSDKLTEMILRHRESCRLVDPTKAAQYGLILLQYARIISAHNMLTAATKITRKVLPATFFSNISTQDQFSVRLIQASVDHRSVSSPRLDDSSCPLIFSDRSQRNSFSGHQDLLGKTVLLCNICRLGVHGLVSLCPLCSHGGHLEHVTAWFARPSSQGCCATGCGCQCVLTDNLKDSLPPPT